MMSLTFGLFTQVSGSGPLGPLVFNDKGPVMQILVPKGRSVIAKFYKNVLRKLKKYYKTHCPKTEHMHLGLFA